MWSCCSCCTHRSKINAPVSTGARLEVEAQLVPDHTQKTRFGPDLSLSFCGRVIVFDYVSASQAPVGPVAQSDRTDEDLSMCEELAADPHALEVHGLGCPEQVKATDDSESCCNCSE